jgi:fumarate reductase subunit C
VYHHYQMIIHTTWWRQQDVQLHMVVRIITAVFSTQVVTDLRAVVMVDHKAAVVLDLDALAKTTASITQIVAQTMCLFAKYHK